MKLPTITTKQQQILKLLYRHRFLERKHIQQYLGHIDKRRSSRWLKDLKEKQFVDWIYDPTNPDERSNPAIFFLDTNGIRYLRSLGNYQEVDLRKRYKDGSRERDFIDRCLLLADCCLHLKVRNINNGEAIHFDCALNADYNNPDNDFFYLAESEYIQPDLTFVKHVNSGGEVVDQTYFMQLFSLSTPRYMVKKKIKEYAEYLASDEWEQASGGEELPIILIACPTVAELIFAKRYTKKQLADLYDDEMPESIKIRFTTLDKLKTKGLTAIIWEDI